MDWADSEDASGSPKAKRAPTSRANSALRGNSALRKSGGGADPLHANDSTPPKPKNNVDESEAIGTGTGPMPEKTEVVDRTGVKTITEWFMNEEGKRVKRVIKTKIVKKEKRIPNSVIARQKSWVKFGVCAGQKDGPEDGITRQEGLSVITVTKKTKKEQKESVMQQALNAKLTAIASKTKYKFTPKGIQAGATGDDFWDAARKKYYGEDGVPDGEGGDAGGLKMTHTREGGGYVAPARRAGAGTKMTEGSRFGSRDDSSTVRITNLSDEAVENDLQELCRPFGPIQRVYLARDKQTSMSRGFAFVNYHRREDAIKAIEKLNGYGYDNLILRVEWAKPSGDGPGGKSDAPAGGRSYSDRPPR